MTQTVTDRPVATEIIFYGVEVCASFSEWLREPLSIIDRIGFLWPSELYSSEPVAAREISAASVLIAADWRSRDAGAEAEAIRGRVQCPLIFSRGSEPISCWRPGDANPPPGLIIGTFLEGNPPSFQPLNTFDLAPSPVSADPWEVAAAACGLANNRVYHYWFEVTNMSPKTPAPARILCTDPTAWTVDWRLRAPALVGHSEGRVCAGLCQP